MWKQPSQPSAPTADQNQNQIPSTPTDSLDQTQVKKPVGSDPNSGLLPPPPDMVKGAELPAPLAAPTPIIPPYDPYEDDRSTSGSRLELESEKTFHPPPKPMENLPPIAGAASLKSGALPPLGFPIASSRKEPPDLDKLPSPPSDGLPSYTEAMKQKPQLEPAT